MVKCPKCGRELPDGTVFCLNCFTSLIEKPAEVNSAKKAGRIVSFLRSKYFKIACTAVITLAITVTGALLMKNYIRPTITVAAEDTTLIEVTDENGKAVVVALVEVTDKSGETVTNSDGSKKLQTVVPVTNQSGEAVTSKNGQQVFEVITQGTGVSPSPSETTTKLGIFGLLFDDNEDKNKDTGTSATAPKTTEKSEESTAKPTTQPATQPTNDKTESSDFEYDIYNGYVRILKYTGTDKNVNVPAQIDGTAVGYIGSGAFPGDIRTITFNSNIYTDPAATGHCFSALNKCTELEAVNINNSSKHKSVDGVVFSSDNALYYYPVGKKTADYTLPSFCNTLLSKSIMDNPYIRTFSFSAENSGQYPGSQANNFMGCSSLTAINAKNTDKVKSIDGVIYFTGVGNYSTDGIQISKYTQFIFPAGKQVGNYEFPSEYEIYIGENSFCGNPYITSAKFHNKVCFSVTKLFNSKYTPGNLKKYYFPDNTEQHAFYESNERTFEAYGVTVEFY
jgi:hypothetical protein